MKKRNKIQSRSFYVKFCPRCRSLNIQVSHQGKLSGLVVFGLPTLYICKDCGFSSYAFPEVNLHEAEEKWKKKKKVK